MTYRKDIQILRGVAVVLVVLFHLGIPGFASGFLGVDVFFVISGFLMAVLYDERKKTEFFRRRALRLLPAYFVTIIATTLASVFLVTPSEYQQVFNQSLSATLFSSNFWYWAQNSYFSKSEFNPLLHLWSLGVEIQFYLLVPLIFFFPRISRIFFWLFLLLSLLLCFLVLNVSPKTSFFMMPLRLWEFMIGYGVAKYLSDNGNLSVRFSNAIAGVFSLFLVIGLSFLNIEESRSILTGHPGLVALLISLATAGVLVFGLPAWFNEAFPGDLLELIGKYSYSIYLVHFPVIVLVLYQPFSGTILTAPDLQSLLLIVLLVTVLSWLMFNRIETRLRQHPHIFRILAFMPVAVLMVSASGSVMQGRWYSPHQLLVAAATRDRDEYRCGKVFRALHPLTPVCSLNEGAGERRVLLVGNSHADSLKRSFTDVATRHGKEVLFLVPNDPLMPGSRLGVEQVIGIAETAGVEQIVLHYSPGAVGVDRIEQIAQQAGEVGIAVSFLMPVPVWNVHVPRILWQHLEDSAGVPYQDIHGYREQYSELRDGLAEIKTGMFNVYEVAPSLCDPVCQLNSDEGIPFYFDNAHLTLTGARMLEDLFDTVLSDE